MADLTGIPVEVVAQDEPGAFGAAILAGVGGGVYRVVSAPRSRELVTVSRRVRPGPRQGRPIRRRPARGWLPGEGGASLDTRRDDRPAGPLPPISTPALVVDLDVFEANVAAMNGLLAGHRQDRPAAREDAPHTGDRAASAGRVGRGVTCATVGEAEAMVDAGIDDILVANEVVDPAQDRAARGPRPPARVAVAVDDRRAGGVAVARAAPRAWSGRRPDRRRHPAAPLRGRHRRRRHPPGASHPDAARV